MKYNSILLTAAVCLCANMAFSQQRNAPVDYHKEAAWIWMMNDTTVNFFETVKAFREYYEVHTMPVEASETSTGDGFEREIGLEKEKEKMDAKERAREHEHELNRARRKSASGKPQLAAEVRAFRGWYFETKPWVREDGVIIGPVQRQQIVDRQQQELREIEKANGKK